MKKNVLRSSRERRLADYYKSSDSEVLRQLAARQRETNTSKQSLVKGILVELGASSQVAGVLSFLYAKARPAM